LKRASGVVRGTTSSLRGIKALKVGVGEKRTRREEKIRVPLNPKGVLVSTTNK